MSKSPVSAYLQLGEPVDSFQPGNDKQLVDLDEYFQETDQPQANAVVQGTESLALGVLSREVAMQLGLKNAGDMDPFASARNAVMGTEGFISTIVEGFKTFIENIIKYIRMACNWIADTVKTIFGFKKTERIEKAYEASYDNLRKEFMDTLTGLGFPGHEYNLEAFIGKFPPATGRMAQLHLMKSKFATDEEAIKGLTESLPLLQQCVGKLTQCSDKAIKSYDHLKRVIKEEYNKSRARVALNEPVNSAGESPEVNRVVKACMDVQLTLDTVALQQDVAKLMQGMYNVSFENDALTEGFSEFRKKIDTQVAAEVVKITPANIGLVMNEIQILNARYVDIADNTIDMSRINLKALGEAVDKTDADKVKAISDTFGHPAPVTAYQQTAVAQRNFVQFCQAVSRQLLVAQRQIYNLVAWHARCNLWYYHGLLDNFAQLRAISAEAQKEGYKGTLHADGSPMIQMDFIPEADARTFVEKFGVDFKNVYEQDIAGLKTTYNNFVKSSGWGQTA